VEFDSGARDIGHVAGYEDHPVDLRGCGHEAILDRDRKDRVDPAPFLCDRPVDRQDLCAEALLEFVEPAFEHLRLSPVTRP